MQAAGFINETRQEEWILWNVQSACGTDKRIYNEMSVDVDYIYFVTASQRHSNSIKLLWVFYACRFMF
jgi:hypothetical protein